MPPGGFGPPTSGPATRRSFPLSYGGIQKGEKPWGSDSVPWRVRVAPPGGALLPRIYG